MGTRERTSAGFEGVGTEGKDVGGEAGLEERGFVGRYSGGGRLGRSSHGSTRVGFLDCSKIYKERSQCTNLYTILRNKP